MILQTNSQGEQLPFFEVIIFIIPFLIITFIIFGSFGLHKYRARPSKIPLYFSLSNFSYVAALLSILIGIIDTINAGQKTTPYFLSLMFMNIFIVLSAIFFFLFESEMFVFESSKKKKVLGIGAGIIIFHLLPQNEWNAETQGFKLMYISFLLLMIFTIYVYYSGMKEFDQLRKISKEREKEIRSIRNGAFYMLLFFTLMFVRTLIDNIVLQIASFGILLIAMSLFFIGFGVYSDIVKNIRDQQKQE
jgi:hypothetical protein